MNCLMDACSPGGLFTSGRSVRPQAGRSKGRLGDYAGATGWFRRPTNWYAAKLFIPQEMGLRAGEIKLLGGLVQPVARTPCLIGLHHGIGHSQIRCGDAEL